MPGKKNTHCGVKKCPSNVSGHRMSVYGIPEDRLIKRKWLKAMKKASFGPSAGVCERHFTDDSFVPKSKKFDFRGRPYLKNKLQHDAVPTLYLDHNSDDFKAYRATELAKEKQIKKSSKNDDKNRAEELAKVPFKKSSKDNDKKFLIFKCKFCERSYSEGPMFQKHLSEAHNVSGPDAFDVHPKVSNQEFLDSIGIGSSVSNANKVENQIVSKEQNSIGIPPTIIKVNVANHEAVDEVVSKLIAGSEMNKHNLDIKQESIDVNPWNITSLHDLQYFICPSCDFQNSSKQTFVCHAFASHPEAVDFLKNISDGSLDNVLCPWNSQGGIMGNSKTMDTPDLTWSYEETSDVSTSKVEANDDDINQDDPLKANSENEDTSFNEINSETIKMEVVDNLNDSAVMEKNENEETPKLPHKCQYCGKCFANKSKLDLHVDIFHEFKCELCNEFFFMESALNVHMNSVHEGQKNYKCDYCEKSFGSKQVLEKHTLNIHGQVIRCYVCETTLESGELCGKKFSTDFDLKRHICGHENKCPQCGQEFKHARNLKRHLETVHEGRRDFKCNSCEKSYGSKQELDRHTHNFHEGHENCPKWCENRKKRLEDFICDSCGSSYSGALALDKHILEAHDGLMPPKDHKCENCGKAFASKERLSVHVLGIHQGIRPYICEIPLESGELCGKKFSTLFDLRRHRGMHEEQPKNEPCLQCIDPTTGKPKLFKNPWYLKHHIKMVHEGLKPNQCETCGKAFQSASYMRSHKRIAHEGFKVVCDQCGIEYRNKKHLIRHIARDHEDNEGKDFKCEHCGKEFNNHGNLSNHIIVIHKKKLSPSTKLLQNGKVCDTCGRSFPTNYDLKQHVRVKHEGIREKCELCDKTFTLKKYLRNHVKGVHEGIRINCETCGKAMQDKDSLRKHVKAIHEGLKEHVCKYCNKGFGYSGTLSSHVRAVHLKEPNVWKRKPKPKL